MSSHLFDGEWRMVIHYLLPLAAFIAGIFLTEWISLLFAENRLIRWQQIILAAEAAVLASVAFIMHKHDSTAAVLVSFSCAMQVQAFRQAGGLSYASTMIIGNLRSGTEEFALFLREHKKERLHYALFYFGVILVFALGAGAGGVLSQLLGLRAILVSALALLLAFALMFIRTKTDNSLPGGAGDEAKTAPEAPGSGADNTSVTPSP